MSDKISEDFDAWLVSVEKNRAANGWLPLTAQDRRMLREGYMEAALAQQPAVAVPEFRFIPEIPEQMARDLARFNETCEDGQEYDVPKERMRDMASFGLVRWCGGSRFEITDCGIAALEVIQAPSAPAPAAQHADDAAVDRFAVAMKAKMAAARAKGRGGWDDPAQCSVENLAEMLVEHISKGNAGTFEDVANFAMMLHQRGADPRVLAPAAQEPVAVEVMRFQLKHPDSGEVHTVEFTRAEVADGMEDSLYEKLSPMVCQCNGDDDHECVDYIHDFDLVSAPPDAEQPSGDSLSPVAEQPDAVKVPRDLLQALRDFTLLCDSGRAGVLRGKADAILAGGDKP